MSTEKPSFPTGVDADTIDEKNLDTGFGEILSSFEQQHSDVAPGETVPGTVVSLTSGGIFVDVGRKIEGFLSLEKLGSTSSPESLRPGEVIPVSIGPRNPEGYYELSLVPVRRPKDWSGMQAAFDEKRTVAGVVTEQVKGGFRVDLGVPAFLPASRSGVREMADMPGLIGQSIECRITKLDVEHEDVVVDRRVVLEEERSRRRDEAFSGLQEGAVVRGRVRTVMDFGAFLDLGGVDGLLHVVDMSFSRVSKASEVVSIDEELEVKILKIDPAAKKISLGLKQLQEDPWTTAARTLQTGDRVSGTVARLADFGAFIELLPGVDGLIHLSELSWNKRVRKPSDLLKVGDVVETVVLQVNPAERRIALGYKQVLGDPWESVTEKFPVGSTVEGPVTNLTQFGAFVQLAEGVEAMIHISDITHEKRLDHPREKLAKGQNVRAVVLDIDRDKRRIRIGMKQLEPTTVDTYISEHQPGETVSGRLVEVYGDSARVELGEGVIVNCSLKSGAPEPEAAPERKSADIGSLSAMLAARWKSGIQTDVLNKPAARAGEVRSFRIASLDPAKRLIELELAS